MPQRLIFSVRRFAFFLALCLPLLASTALGAGKRVLEPGQTPKDRRLEPLKHLNDYFPFTPPESEQAWRKRSAELKRQVLVATGLWPMPKRTASKAVIHGKVDRQGFTVEKVYLQSVPGHFVTGLLYRPKDRKDRHPAVLCPHGHGGRLQDYGEANMKKLIEQGAEEHAASGRYPKMARCAQLARMGCVVFIFDMEGYADNTQIPRPISHRYGKQRPGVETKHSWRLFGAQAELRMQSIMGLQTWNSIRALDFLCGLPDVDASRVGVTGGSGGGTQTILLGAIDSRPIVAFPQGMVSTSMQGGCICENCCLLRVGSGNVELTALFAPRPQGMTAANDWTKEMMTKGYPQLKQLYKTLGAEENVLCKPLLHFPHNYNYVTRGIMYSWFNKHLKLGHEEPIVEADHQPLTAAEWSVWNDEHPRPKGGESHERQLLKVMSLASDEQIQALTPKIKSDLAEYRRVIGGAFQALIGRGLPNAKDISREKVAKEDRGDYLEMRDLLRLDSEGEELPLVSLYPKATPWNKQVVLWVHGDGKAGLYDDQGNPRAAVKRLLKKGAAVLSVDLVMQGEFLAEGEKTTQNRRVANNSREYAGYTYGYNHPLFAQRVHDILTLIQFVATDEHGTERVDLVGVGGAGPLAATARALAGGAVHRAAIDTAGFRFGDLTSYRDVNFLPGALKYGDLPAILALSAPHELWVVGEKEDRLSTTIAVYTAAGSDQLTIDGGASDKAAQRAVKWLLSK